MGFSTHTPVDAHTSLRSLRAFFSSQHPQHQTRKAAMMLSASLTRKAVAVRRANSSRSARVGAVRNGSRVCMMQTLKPQRRYENLSYLPQLTPQQTLQCGPGFYHNRYWLMWKLPMFGCTDPSAILKEIDECAKEYPGAQVRVIGFDRIAQVQKAGFLAKK